MYPELFKIGPLTVHSYGLMLAIAFIVASSLLNKELKRKGLDPNYGSTITLLAVIFGIIGAKLLFVLEDWNNFLREPLRELFSPGGLTWYGGFILAVIAILHYTRKKKIPFIKICDATSPGLAIGYGIARIGCHLAGDGDYGVPTDLPWGCVYSNGTYPPSVAFRDFPEIVQKYGVNGIVPDSIPVHPAPIYELLLGIIIFIILMRLRTKISIDGRLFMIYLVLTGIARFAVELIRINPPLLIGLSEAQLISFLLVIIGTIGLFRLKNIYNKNE